MRAINTWILIVLLLSPTITVHAWPIPDTGLTKCYNDTFEIPCPAPGDAFYGQDGSYTITPSSYTKLDAYGNALPDDAMSWVMVRDNVTRLIWEKKTTDSSIHDASKTFTWCDNNTTTNGGNQGSCGTGTGDASTDTEAYIKAFNDAKYGGFSDWRLPTEDELRSIIHYQTFNPSIKSEIFPFMNNAYYWSSTSFSSIYALKVGFYYGSDEYSPKTEVSSVIAVRGKYQQQSYVDNNDGTITDTITGLMWEKDDSNVTRTWGDVLISAYSSSTAGYNDWRLANTNELQSIIDYTKGNPVINTTAFPNTKASAYWSSTTKTYGSGNQAWYITFQNGTRSHADKTESYYYRLVRGGQELRPGSLVIQSPARAEKLFIGSPKIIVWDTAGISGNVKITLSRQGGKAGTFIETIADGIPNNGSYNWVVTGPASVNCVLKIEPQSEIGKITTQGLFTITQYPANLDCLAQDQLNQAIDDANAAKDLIIALKDQTIASMFTKQQLEQAVSAERIKWDVNGDGKMGLEMVIFILQTAAGMR